jgi:alpha-amylase/alpha-mannosidase (GH57 family)
MKAQTTRLSLAAALLVAVASLLTLTSPAWADKPEPPFTPTEVAEPPEAPVSVIEGAPGAPGAPTIVEGGVLFAFSAPEAASVSLAGDFNGWDPGSLPMTDVDGNGTWEVIVPLDPGRTYQYKFVLGGGVKWEPDPLNPSRVDDNRGGWNSVLSITPEGSVVLGPLSGPAGGGKPEVGTMPSLGKPISLAIVWHQHQPKYLRDLTTGEYLEPWVRMHAIKDYYDMVAILDSYPAIRFTVNLTPVLLMQLEDVIAGYEAGTGTDAYLRMTLKDAAALSEDDQIFLLTHFFNANWDNMINVWPRYKALKDKKGGDSEAELLASAKTFSTQDWRDLQAWFNLAWFDPDFQEGDVTLPDGTIVTVKHLIAKGQGFTEADKREIIEDQIAIMKNVVAVHKKLQDRGQIEVITTPFYHPILPLIEDTNLASVATPGTPLPTIRFSRPEDARRQVELAARFYEQRFGRRPVGMWPAEGAVAQAIVGTVGAAGFAWMASDDQVLQYSLGGQPLTPRQQHQAYWVTDGQGKVGMVFRDHRLSDDIGFNYARMDGVDAANSMMRSLYAIHREFASDERDHVVTIILDGENAWEWFRHDGKEFFRSWYDQMSRAPWLDTVTVEEYLATHPPTETIPNLWAGSWISHDFATWIGEPEENAAWEYLAKVRDDLEAEKASADPAAWARAYDEILAAEGSDWFWWYGADQSTANEGSFDTIFRGTLKNVYAILGKEAPAFLSSSILGVQAGATGAGPAVGTMAKAAGAAGGLLGGPLKTEQGYLFSMKEPSAKSVHLAGDFNAWSQTALPLADEDGDGVWTVVVKLDPGTYEYKFVIDGGVRWVEDAGNPDSVSDPYGGKNSVIVVK